jgi:hypothetical protein
VEAGERCVASLSDPATAQAAADQLEAIVTRLRIQEAIPESARALETFEKRLRTFQASERRSAQIGCLVICLVTAALGWLAVRAIVWLGVALG